MNQKRMTWMGAVLVAVFLLSSCNTNPKLSDESLKTERSKEFSFTRGGAPIEVVVRLSQQELALTDFLTVEIESQFEDGVLITPPYLSEAVYNPLLLVENPQEETFWSEQKGLMINRWTYKFEPLVSGAFKLKPFAIYFRLEEEKHDKPEAWPVYQVDTDAIPYQVQSSELGELDDIRDIKGIIYPPYNYWIPLITVTTFITLCLGALLFIRHRRRQAMEFNPNRKLVDYYTEALSRLHELELQGLIGKSEFNKFHTELTAILRDYLEHHFGLRAKEQTSQEFIQEIVRTRRFTPDQRHELDRFLQLADLVKFATFQPGSQPSEEALGNVRTFIQTTGKPHEV